MRVHVSSSHVSAGRGFADGQRPRLRRADRADGANGADLGRGAERRTSEISDGRRCAGPVPRRSVCRLRPWRAGSPHPNGRREADYGRARTVAVWAPNSRFLAFQDSSRLVVVDVRSGKLLTTASAVEGDLAWAPN